MSQVAQLLQGPGEEERKLGEAGAHSTWPGAAVGISLDLRGLCCCTGLPGPRSTADLAQGFFAAPRPRPLHTPAGTRLGLSCLLQEASVYPHHDVLVPQIPSLDRGFQICFLCPAVSPKIFICLPALTSKRFHGKMWPPASLKSVRKLTTLGQVPSGPLSVVSAGHRRCLADQA